MHKETVCVQSGTYHDAVTRSVDTPIFTSSAFEYLDREDVPYPRYFNTPNQGAVTHKLCRFEAAEDGVLFSWGMAAMSTTILAFAGAGDHVVMIDALYGGTHAFATCMFDRIGIRNALLRLSVGIENSGDLLADLSRGLNGGQGVKS